MMRFRLRIGFLLIVGFAESGKETLFLGLLLGRFVVQFHIFKVLVSDRFRLIKRVAVQSWAVEMERTRVE